MIVPGHVVFLWRIIHQHFTLAFLKHNSTCRSNELSLFFGKVVNFLPKTSLTFPPSSLVRSVERSQRRTSEARSVVLVISAAANPEAFLSETAYSFMEVPVAGRFDLFSLSLKKMMLTIRFVTVWRVFGASLRRLDHLDLKLLPHPPGPVPWSCHGREGSGGGGGVCVYTSHLWPMQTWSHTCMKNNVHILNEQDTVKTRKRIFRNI